jgi:hypothetical protein
VSKCTTDSKSAASASFTLLSLSPTTAFSSDPSQKPRLSVSALSCLLLLTHILEEILDEFSKHTTGLTDVILYYQVEEKNKGSGLQKNRGFCFLEYETHQAASQARRRLLSGKYCNQSSNQAIQFLGRVKAWNNLIVTVDWADPINTPGDDIMDKVKGIF